MRISLRDTFRRRRAAQRTRRSRKGAIKHAAACLTLGLATAWGGDADAAIIKLSVTPEQTLTNAWGVFYYYFGVSSIRVAHVSLGTVPGGVTTDSTHTIEDADAEDLKSRGPGFSILGIYDEGGSPGVAVGLPNDSAITAGLEWDERFSSHTELEVLDQLLTGEEASGFAYARRYSLSTDYGTEATIVLFSEAAYGGVVTATIVPEPATFALLVSGAGIVLLRPRRHRGSPQQ